MSIKNRKSGIVHVSDDDNGQTLCEKVLKDFVTGQFPITCPDCIRIVEDEIEDEFDPLGIIDDDMPDGAYWAMHWEIYGY